MKKKTSYNQTKEISLQERKRIMLDMLKHIDDICRENNIKYSLVGGSLIGAIRHRGYIPWDDDIDIILTEKNFKKLVDILDKDTGRYQIYKYGKEYKKMGFRKLIDTKTHLLEGEFAFDPNYGVYVDIFSYCNLSNNDRKRKWQFDKIKLLLKFVTFYRKKIDFKEDGLLKSIDFSFKKAVSRAIGCKRFGKAYENIRKSSDTKSDYVTCFFPVYSYDKEVQLKKNTEDYTDAKFEDLTVMIFKNYDEILRTTYGDYMKLPPKSERIPKHNAKAWWRD